ncbi:MAG: isopentenyl-diphosphate Delta-isomerase [Lacisediminihabitans sp.]
MCSSTELVVLVDDEGHEIGTADKSVVHSFDTPLHLAFSCHVYDESGRVLVTRRALGKLTWPGVWTNSFCGHPGPGEHMADAIARRAELELGVTISGLEFVLPHFRYRAVDASGIVENEICPVYRAVTTDAVRPNPDEVAEWRWVDPQSLRASAAATPFAFSPWLVLQLEQWEQ